MNKKINKMATKELEAKILSAKGFIPTKLMIDPQFYDKKGQKLVRQYLQSLQYDK